MATQANHQANRRLVRRITDEVINGGDLGLVRELFTAEYRLHKSGLSLPRGPEAFKMAVRQWRDAFPDYRVEVVALIAEDELVACQFTASGSHQGSLLGTPPTGKSFSLTGTDLYRIVDGLVVESWGTDDLPRILTELGVLAPTSVGANQWT